MRLTGKQYAALASAGSKPRPLPQARARHRHKTGQMNGYERAYAEQVLEPQRIAGEIAAYWFERFTFRLADDCRYTPDFLVQLTDGTLELREIKGHWEDDALVKIKVAAEMFPIFAFIAVERTPKKDGGGWKTRSF